MLKLHIYVETKTHLFMDEKCLLGILFQYTE